MQVRMENKCQFSMQPNRTKNLIVCYETTVHT